MTTSNYKNTEINQVRDSGNSNISNNSMLEYNTVHIAYNINKVIEQILNSKCEEYLTTLPGWKPLCHSLISDETSAYNLRAAVFINKSKKALHFAFAGTDPSSCYDLLDDFYVYRNKTINKLNPMQSLVNKVDEVIGVEKVVNYNISSSGHSLGAILSDLLAAEMLSQGRKFTMSTTFDSPGSKPIIEEAIQNNLIAGSKELCIGDVAEHCKVFVVTPNFINSTNTQISNDIRLVVPSNTKQSEYEYGQLGWSSFLYNMVGIACNTVADFLGINNVIRGVTEHKLSSFADYDDRSVKVSRWIEYDKKTGNYNPTPIILEEDNPGLALKIKQTQPSTNKDLLFVSEEEGYIKGQWIASTQLEEVQNMQSTKDGNGSSTEDADEWTHIEDEDEWLYTENYNDYYSEDESDYHQETSGQASEANVNII